MKGSQNNQEFFVPTSKENGKIFLLDWFFYQPKFGDWINTFKKKLTYPIADIDSVNSNINRVFFVKYWGLQSCQPFWPCFGLAYMFFEDLLCPHLRKVKRNLIEMDLCSLKFYQKNQIPCDYQTTKGNKDLIFIHCFIKFKVNYNPVKFN